MLNSVVALTIVDFPLFEDTDALFTRFRLLEKESLIEYSGDIELVFIELPKFRQTEQELGDIRDKWVFFLKNAGSLEYIPTNMDVELRKAFEIANEANLTQAELEAQHKRREFILIQKSALAGAEQRGIQQGIQQVARNLLSAGVPPETIMQTTGLSRTELDDLI